MVGNEDTSIEEKDRNEHLVEVSIIIDGIFGASLGFYKEPMGSMKPTLPRMPPFRPLPVYLGRIASFSMAGNIIRGLITRQ